MRIGIDGSRSEGGERTGVENYSFYLLQELQNVIPQEYDVTVYLRSGQAQNSFQGLPQHWKEKKLGWPFRYAWTQGRLSWEILTSTPDILFIPSHVLPRYAPLRCVATIHDTAFALLPDLYSRAERLWQTYGLDRALKKAYGIVVPSHHIKQTLLEKYPNQDPQRIQVTPLGYDRERFNENGLRNMFDTTLNTYHIHQPYILYVGRLEKKKNVCGLVEAFNIVSKKYDELELVLAGKPGFDYQHIHRSIMASQYSNRIHECGWVTEHELPMLYAQATMTVLPSWYEGFGIPVLESMACGSPVIASSAGALPEIVGDAGLLIDPHDTSALAEAMMHVLEDRAARGSLRIRGLERVKQFSWKKCAEKTWEALTKM